MFFFLKSEGRVFDFGRLIMDISVPSTLLDFSFGTGVICMGITKLSNWM